MSYTVNALKLKAKIDSDRLLLDAMSEYGEHRTEIVPSDKTGFDWKVFYVNDIVVRKDYIEHVGDTETPGTAESPIPWEAELVLYPNTYYTFEGVRKVWMGEFGVTADWTDERFVEF